MERKRNNGHARRVSRRTFVRTAGAAALAGAAWLHGRAPAFAQQRGIHLMFNGSFRPPIDAEVRKYATEFEQATRVKVTTEFININDLAPRAAAAVETGKGPDLMLVNWNQAHLWDRGLADVGDIVEAAGGDRIYHDLRGATLVNGVYRAVPWYLGGCNMTYNKTLCDPLGITKYPDTLDQLLVAGKKMKQSGTPVGWCLGHTTGDGAYGNYPILWSFGAMEVDEKQRVAINSREARNAIEWMRQFWADCCDEGGMGWNDASNNQAFLAQQVAAVYNPPSIYLKARADKNPLADQIRHTIGPAGPAGRFHLNQPYSIAIGGYSQELAAAKDFLRYMFARPQYERMFVAGGGFAQGITPDWEKHKLWTDDPLIAPFAQVGRYGRTMGFKGPFNRASAVVQNKYIIADTLARGIRDGADSALKWAEQELKQIYEGRA